MEYFVLVNDERKGPFKIEELANKYITEDMLVWCEGMENWQKAGDVEELSDIVRQMPPEPPHLKFIKNWLTESITITAICAMVAYLPWFWPSVAAIPFGAVAILKALRVEEYQHRKNGQMARHYANEAKKWALWCLFAFVVAILFSVTYLIINHLVTFSLN